MDSPIGGPQPPAQLAADCGQDPAGNVRMLLRQDCEVRRRQHKAREVLVSDDRGRARASVENGKFAKGGAGSKGPKANIEGGRVEQSLWSR